MRSADGEATRSNDNVIAGNVISRCGLHDGDGDGVGIGISVCGDRNLVENYDISHLGDDFTRMTGGERNVIRGKLLHDNSHDDAPGSTAHIDGLQNWCSDGDLRIRWLLFEGNHLVNAPSPDTHFVIYQDSGGCGNADILVRHNSARDLGSYVQINDDSTEGVRLYRNTFAVIGRAADGDLYAALAWSGGSTGGALIGNIFFDAARVGGGMHFVDGASSPLAARGNLVYDPECGAGSSWSDPVASEVGASINVDPGFVSASDLHLRADSAAIDQGAHLTNVASGDSGSGTTLVVDDNGFFQDGWAGVTPDAIAIGSVDSVAPIDSIDYATNTISLASPIARAPGDPVWLARDSTGTVVLLGSGPDVGAHEAR